MFENVIEGISSLINIRTYTGRVTSSKLVAQLKCLCCQKRFENADQSPIIKCINCQNLQKLVYVIQNKNNAYSATGSKRISTKSICHFLGCVKRIHLRRAAVGDRSSVMKLPLWETNINKLQKYGFYKITNLLSSNYKGLQLYTTSDTKFSEKEMFENVIEDIYKLINKLKNIYGKRDFLQTCCAA